MCILLIRNVCILRKHFEMEKQEDQSINNLIDVSWYKTVINVLCGHDPVPQSISFSNDENKNNEKNPDVSLPVYIKDRSVTHYKNDRSLTVQYLMYLFKHELGYNSESVFVQNYSMNRPSFFLKYSSVVPYQNLIVTIPGADPIQKQFLLYFGAHYDVQNNMSRCWRGDQRVGQKDSSEQQLKDYQVTAGADDNTSGVLSLLFLLRFFKLNPPAKTVKIIFFDGEEPGAWNNLCEGSKIFLKKEIAENFFDKGQNYTWSSVKNVFVVDMIGGPVTDKTAGFILSINSKIDQNVLSKKMVEWNERNGSKEQGGFVTVADDEDQTGQYSADFTDSKVFNEEGWPVMAFSNSSLDTCPSFYHTEKDDVDIMDWKSFAKALEFIQFICVEFLV